MQIWCGYVHHFWNIQTKFKLQEITSRVTRLSCSWWLLVIIRMDAFASHFECRDNTIRCDVDKFNVSLGRLERSTWTFLVKQIDFISTIILHNKSHKPTSLMLLIVASKYDDSIVNSSKMWGIFLVDFNIISYKVIENAWEIHMGILGQTNWIHLNNNIAQWGNQSSEHINDKSHNVDCSTPKYGDSNVNSSETWENLCCRFQFWLDVRLYIDSWSCAI